MYMSKAGLYHGWPLVVNPLPLVDNTSKPGIKFTGGKYVHETVQDQRHVGHDLLSAPQNYAHFEDGADVPSINNLIDGVHEYRKLKDRVRSRKFYLWVCENGLEAHEDLGNYLVPMLVTCGNFVLGQQVFEKLPYRSEYAWTSLLQGFIDHGESWLALDSFHMMQADDVPPSTHTYVALLKVCESLSHVERGQELHAEVVKLGYETDPYICNSLLCMYAKCWLVLDAQNVFDQLLVHNAISWTALMAGYVDCDLSEEALKCLEESANQGVIPDAIMFVCSLKACATLGASRRGRQIHADIIMEGLESDSSVGNMLVDMYAKCGLLEEAKELFDELLQRDVVSWTALMTGFAENSLGEEAVQCLEQMQSEGMIPDAVTYLSGIKACCSAGCVHKGLELHGEILQEGFDTEQTVGNALVDMYAKFGLLGEAQAVFDELPFKDIVSWTALIAGYAEHGFPDEVQSCLRNMQSKGCSPNAATYVCTLKVCSHSGSLSWGQEMHIMFVKEGIESDTFLGNALVDMYSKCGSLVEAQTILNKLPAQNVVSWSALIAGIAEHGTSQMALECLEQMEQAGFSPSAVTLLSALKACCNDGGIEGGYVIHNEVIKKGFETLTTCGNMLVDMYAKCGFLTDSYAVFDKLPNRDVVSWTVIMAGYAEHGCGDQAVDFLVQMQLEGVAMDVMLWNTAIVCHAEQGKTEKAFLAFMSMQEQCVLPNSFSFVSVLQACCTAAAMEVGRRIHTQVEVVKRHESTEDVLSTALIDMYGKCSNMTDALQVFESIPTKKTVQWNALLTGYARQGKSEVVFHAHDKMREERIQLDEVTFSSILFACSHGGLVGKGQVYYETMVEEFNIAPNIKHHSCMVDLLGRAGNLIEAVAMLEKLPSQVDLVAWISVLGACLKSGDVELGEEAFRSSKTLNGQDATIFILMANAYADVNE